MDTRWIGHYQQGGWGYTLGSAGSCIAENKWPSLRVCKATCPATTVELSWYSTLLYHRTRILEERPFSNPSCYRGKMHIGCFLETDIGPSEFSLSSCRSYSFYFRSRLRRLLSIMSEAGFWAHGLAAHLQHLRIAV